MKTITRDYESKKKTIPIGLCNQQKKIEEALSENRSFQYLDDKEGDDGSGNIGDLLKKYENEPLEVLPYFDERTKLSKKFN